MYDKIDAYDSCMYFLLLLFGTDRFTHVFQGYVTGIVVIASKATPNNVSKLGLVI